MRDKPSDMTSGIKCLLLCVGEISDFTAYKQRALMMAGQLEELECRVSVLWFSRLSNLFAGKLILRRHWLTIPMPPYYAVNGLLCRISRFLSALIVRLVIKLQGIELVFAENPTAAALGVGSSVPLICDFHGDILEERKMQESPQREIRIALEDETNTCRCTSAWVCASGVLLDVLRARYRTTVPAVVAPCCVDISDYAAFRQRREKTRTDFRLGGRPVVCYVGGLAKWQEIPSTLSLVTAMKAKEPELFFLLITRDDIAPYASQLASIGKEGIDYAHLSLSHQEVIEVLPAADLGMLLRSPSPVNYVSSPTKCGEYLASGVPVLTTAYAGDAARVISETNAGVVLHGSVTSQESVEVALGFLRTAVSNRESIAERSHLAAKDHYNRIQTLRSLERLLEQVVPGSSENRSEQPGVVA